MKRLVALIVTAVVLGSVALFAGHGRATASALLAHCPSVSTLNGFKHSYPLVVEARGASCAEALAVIRAMVSGVGVTFQGNPNGAAYQFRWKLYGLLGWTCVGDGSGFPGHGAGGDCSKAGATVEWYHA